MLFWQWRSLGHSAVKTTLAEALAVLATRLLGSSALPASFFFAQCSTGAVISFRQSQDLGLERPSYGCCS
jgi:hypothetical protein